MYEKPREQGAEEATKIWLEMQKDLNTFVQNYGKMAHIKGILTQKFARRIVEVAGSVLEKRRAQGENIPTPFELAENYLVILSVPLHHLGGSTPNEQVMDAREQQLDAWLGKDNVNTLITELNTELLTYARSLDTRKEEELQSFIQKERAALVNLLQQNQHPQA